MITFVLIADAHLGPEKDYEGQVRKLSRNSLPFLTSLTAEISTSFKPAFVAQLGDLIEDSDDLKQDKLNFSTAINTFEGLSMPVLHVIGNHDQVHLSIDDLSALIHRDVLYYSLDVGDLHCVVLFASCLDHTDIHIDEQQRQWLVQDLEKTQKPTVVFLHHPLDEQNLQGNVWFEKYPSYCFVEERKTIRQILVASGQVVAVFNGHVHHNNLSTIDGIHYITIQSLVEKVGEPDVSSRAFALATIDGDNLSVEVMGRDPARYFLPLIPMRRKQVQTASN